MLSFSPILAGRRNWMHFFHRPFKMRLLIFHLHARQCFSRCKLDCFILVFIFKIGQIKLPKFLRHLLGTITLNWSLASPNRAPSWTQTFERLSSTATSSTASWQSTWRSRSDQTSPRGRQRSLKNSSITARTYWEECARENLCLKLRHRFGLLVSRDDTSQ